MTISITTPALIFPAISLIMLAYTNRYIALSGLIRTLHQQYIKGTNTNTLIQQIASLRKRLRLVQYMQFLGVLSFVLAIVCMFFIYTEVEFIANAFFSCSLISFVLSLLLSLWEIQISMHALSIELSDMRALQNS